MEYLDYILTKNDIHKLISKVLTKSGAYNVPKDKNDLKPQLNESAKEALETLTNALKLINQLHDLSVDYSKELSNIKNQNGKLVIENAKMKVKLNEQKLLIDNLKQHIEL